jgi:succinate dehydrogenase / fumarate reductase cytochrome b subunit
MNKKNRPLSPHLSIYKAQITSILSIFHRITGFFSVLILLMLSFYFILFCSFGNFNLFYSILSIFANFSFIIVSLLCITFFFHFNNGIRHILWDFGFGLDLNNITISGLLVLLITFVIAFILILF